MVYDLIVIGGGINGVGMVWDGVLWGLKIFLIEKDDFVSGMSSWFICLIYGGLCYLEYFEFNLVWEFLWEWEVLFYIVFYLV